MAVSRDTKRYWIKLIGKRIDEQIEEKLEFEGLGFKELFNALEPVVLTELGTLEIYREWQQTCEAIEAMKKHRDELKSQLISKFGRETGYWGSDDWPQYRLESLVNSRVKEVRKNSSAYKEVMQSKKTQEQIEMQIELATSPTKLAEYLKDVLPKIGIETEFEL